MITKDKLHGRRFKRIRTVLPVSETVDSRWLSLNIQDLDFVEKSLLSIIVFISYQVTQVERWYVTTIRLLIETTLGLNK